MASPAFVQQKDNGALETTTVNITPTAGNMLFVGASTYNGGASTTASCADNRGNTYVALTPGLHTYNRFGFYAFNVKGAATTITITYGVDSYAGIIVAEYSGVDTFDTQAGKDDGTEPSITTGFANELVITWISGDEESYQFSGATFTPRVPSYTPIDNAIGDAIKATKGSITPDWNEITLFTIGVAGFYAKAKASVADNSWLDRGVKTHTGLRGLR